MRTVHQTKFTDLATGTCGNCLAACFASLMNISLEEVPQFEKMFDREDLFSAWEEVEEAIARLCAERNYKCFGRKQPPVPHDNRFYIVSFTVPDSLVNHCVIWRNGRIVHDPRPEKVELGQIHRYYDIRKIYRANRTSITKIAPR